MYLPKSKYSKPKYTRGDQFELLNGTDYIGWYFKTYRDEYFTGKAPTSKSQKLKELIKDDTGDTGRQFVNDYVKPTEEDYENGFITRFFLQDVRNKSIIEVKQTKYNTLRKLPYINGVKIDWVLTSPAQDGVKNGYIFFGSASKNKELVLEAEKVIKNLSSTIKSYGEFVK